MTALRPAARRHDACPSRPAVRAGKARLTIERDGSLRLRAAEDVGTG